MRGSESEVGPGISLPAKDSSVGDSGVGSAALQIEGEALRPHGSGHKYDLGAAQDVGRAGDRRRSVEAVECGGESDGKRRGGVEEVLRGHRGRA